MVETKLMMIQPDTTQDSDTALVLAAQQNPLRFQAIYDRWARPVYRYFYFRTGDIAIAEDLTSQLFLSALQALSHYRDRGHFAAWLFTIARNLAAAFYRKAARETSLETAAAIHSPSDPAEEVTQAHEIRALKRLIHDLPEEEQELIRLRYVAGLSFAEMATALGKREDAVKKSLYRLQARLQSLLEQNHV